MQSATVTARIFLFALLPGPTVGGKAFLGNDPELKAAQVQQELNGVLAEMLGHGHGVDVAHIEQIQEYLKPIFHSLPKNGLNRLSASVMRYAVQRYFSERHGWIIKGFEPHAKAANITYDASNGHILQSKLPDYVRTVLEEKFSQQGFAIEDAAVMIAAVERLTFDDVIRGSERAFMLNRLSLTAEMSLEEFFEVVASYILTEMLEGADDYELHQINKANIATLYPHWSTTVNFVHDEIYGGIFAGKHRSNPFVKKESFNFEDVTRAGQQISGQFAIWSNHECIQIKEGLVEMDPYHTGRVKLSDFYSKANNGGWQFKESLDYLRTLGAIDESNTLLGPQVIVANYVSGMSNCITSTPFYSICCLNECDTVYQHLEATISKSSASAAEIINAVESIHYSATSFVDAKNLTVTLRKRLEEVAAHHGDRVPLHGRMVAQWLHYVFPRECPYPHMEATLNPLTPGAYEETHGEDATRASEDEKNQFLESESARVAASPEAGAEMWTFHEDVLEASTPSDLADGGLRKVLRLLTYMGMITGFGVSVLKAWKDLLLPMYATGTLAGKPVQYDV